MFKSIITAVATASVALAGFSTGAEARSNCFTVRSGYDVCTIDNGHYGSDSIGIFNRNDRMVAFMKVICTGNGGNRWEGERDTAYISYNDMQSTANWWCANY